MSFVVSRGASSRRSTLRCSPLSEVTAVVFSLVFVSSLTSCDDDDDDDDDGGDDDGGDDDDDEDDANCLSTVASLSSVVLLSDCSS